MSRLAVVVIILLAGSSIARAGDADNKAAARALYLEGRRLYDVGEYRASLDAFKRAYLKYEDSSFLFNIGQCHRQLNQKAEALQAYRSYLRNTPDAPNREDVQRFISQLQAALADEVRASSQSKESKEPPASARPDPSRSAATVAPTPAISPPSRVAAVPIGEKPVYKKWWLWATVVGVVAAGVGVGLGVYYGTRTFEPTLAGFSQGSALMVRY